MKVYCAHCKWFHESPFSRQCWHPLNHKDTAIRPKEELIDSPMKINRKNDCGNFGAKRRYRRKYNG